ncbi:hypothetical protein [Lysobacter gummosus]|uniref:hypothetical protein n=1 Tax=Lysobacter gummosus TaxID=262324 RepID=UPI00362F150D
MHQPTTRISLRCRSITISPRMIGGYRQPKWIPKLSRNAQERLDSGRNSSAGHFSAATSPSSRSKGKCSSAEVGTPMRRLNNGSPQDQ